MRFPRTLLIAMVLMVTPPVAAAWEVMSACDDHRLSPSIETRLAPVLNGLLKARSAEDWYLPEYVGPLHELFRAKGAGATESRIALLAYYIGEHYGEELLCAVSNDGQAALPLIERYQRCRPRSSLDPLPGSILGSGTLYDMAAQLVRDGETCDLHE